MIRVDINNTSISYTAQIYDQIKKMILKGILSPGERLPSTRKMSEELKVSRNTILSAYDWLISEGYAYTNGTAGTYIGEKAFLSDNIEGYITNVITDDEMERNDFGIKIDFNGGIPALDMIPKQKLGKILSEIMINSDQSVFGYDFPEGRPELRNTIAGFLKKSRNINCIPDQIIITSGTKQAMTLVGKCLLNKDSEIYLEDPSFINIRKIFGYHCNNFKYLPTDNDGVITSNLPDGGKPTIIFTTPSHQIPMGGILPIQRRLELIEFAKKNNSYIVEDDYDSEFNYDNKFIPTIKELDINNERVIYAGTFSKVLYPSLRIGYLILPGNLLEAFREVKRLGDQHTNSINQLMLNTFIKKGYLNLHILKMKKVYKARRDFLIKTLIENFGNSVKIIGSCSGMHLIAQFDGIVFTPEIINKIELNGVSLPPPIESIARIKGNHIGQIALGYTNLSLENISKGIEIIRSVI